MNRAAEAEPLSCRSVEILAAFQRNTGHAHFHSDEFRNNYLQTLHDLGVPKAEALRRLEEVVQGANGEFPPGKPP